MLEEGEDGAAAGQAGVADAGELQLLRGREAAQVERLERGLREVQAAVEEGGFFCLLGSVAVGYVLLDWALGGWKGPLRSTCCCRSSHFESGRRSSCSCL